MAARWDAIFNVTPPVAKYLFSFRSFEHHASSEKYLVQECLNECSVKYFGLYIVQYVFTKETLAILFPQKAIYLYK